MTMIVTFVAESPAGPLEGAVRDGALVALEFAGQGAPLAARLARRFPGETVAGGEAPGIVAALAAYAAGDVAALDTIAEAPGGTPFQAAVWRALREIPPGTTESYAALARRIGRPSAVRAVAAANARNPIAIVIPCHRVIGSDGTLTGYAGGIERKASLLAHERTHAGRAEPELALG